MESSIRAHLIPVLGEKPLTAIDIKAIQELITSMSGRARGSVENVVMDLQQILSAARKWHNGIGREEIGVVLRRAQGRGG